MSKTRWHAVWSNQKSRSRRFESYANGRFQSLSAPSVKRLTLNCDTLRRYLNFFWTDFDIRPCSASRDLVELCLKEGRHFIHSYFRALIGSSISVLIGTIGGDWWRPWNDLQRSFQCFSRGYRGGSPTAVQAWQPCPLWELSLSHPHIIVD